jgi:3-hydroxyisobutyrate dehydrogenase
MQITGGDLMGQTVAVLGLGTMGNGMALNLLKAGHSVTVYNRTSAKAEALRAAGARVAATVAEAARDAQFVITILADDAASRDVWLGSEGVLHAAGAGTVLIESSTVSPVWISELAEAANQRALDFLDAPVTGSRTQAATGQLTFLVGGRDSAVATATPILQAMSKEIIHLGPVGSGAKLKLINNFLCGVQVASLAEGLVWIEQSGLDRDKALAVLKSGAPGSPLISAISARMESKDYEVNFLLRLMAKDLSYAEAEAGDVGVELSTAGVARALFDKAIRAGYGDADMSSVIEPLRRQEVTRR